MNHLGGIVRALVLILAGSGVAWSQDAPTGQQDVQHQWRQWIDQLGADSYAVRERAAQNLSQVGLAARGVLTEALRHNDLEIRLRAHQILISIVQSEFDTQLTLFLEDDQPGPDYDLPAWRPYRESIGFDRPSRTLFAEMVRAETGLLEMLEGKNGSLLEAFKQRMQIIQNGVQGPFGNAAPISSATVATMLFVAVEGDFEDNSVVGSQIYTLLNMASARQAVEHGTQSPILKRLLERWISGQRDGTQAYYALNLALTYELKDKGLELARELLKEQGATPIVVQYAAMNVGRFGDRSDLPLLETHLENSTVCHTWSNPQLKKDLIRIQVRDVVLGIMIHLTEQQHKDYGFQFIQQDPVTVFRIYTMGFLEDEERDKALEHWNRWREQHP